MRVVSLTVNTFDAMRTKQLGFGSLLRSPEHVVASLFPTRARTKQAIQHSLELFSPHRPLWAQLIHEEIGHKKKMLQTLRTQQATRLGLLMKMAPQFTSDNVPQKLEQYVRLMELVMEPLVADSQQITRVDVQRATGKGH